MLLLSFKVLSIVFYTMYVFIHNLYYRYNHCYLTPLLSIMLLAERGTHQLGRNSQRQQEAKCNINNGLQPHRAVHVFFRFNDVMKMIIILVANLILFLITHHHLALELNNLNNSNHVQGTRVNGKEDHDTYAHKPP